MSSSSTTKPQKNGRQAAARPPSITVPERALSICQPWAWAVAAGHKTIENRTWQTPYRGPIAIHASLSKTHFHEQSEADLYEMGGDAVWNDCENKPYLFDAEYWGAIIGVANLVDIVPASSIPGHDQAELLFGPNGEIPEAIWAEGPYCWLLRDAVFFDGCPVKCAGRVNLFHLPPDIVRQVAASLDKSRAAGRKGKR